MKILYENYVIVSSITVSSEITGFLFSDAMNDSRLSRFARTSGKTSEWITFNLGTPKAITDVCIKGHNLSATATITLQGNATSDFTSPSYSNVLAVTDTIWEAFTAETYQYWRLSIQDTSNVSAFIQIAYVFLGSGLTMPGMSPDQVIIPKSNSKYTKSYFGQLYGDQGIKYVGEKINIPDMNQTEVEGVDTFIDYVDIITPFILIKWEEDVSNYPPLYCHLVQLPEKPRSSGQGLLWNQSIQVEECK